MNIITPGPIQLPQKKIKLSQLISVESIEDLPPVINNAITLAADTTYFIVSTVDLNGARLIGSQNSTLFGFSPEVSILKSTGFDDTDGAFITTEWSLPCNLVAFHDFTDQQVLDIDGNGNNAAYDWNGINFLNCQNVGTVANVGNFIGATIGFLESGGLTFDGSIGTISFSASIFTRFDGGPIITIPSTLTITRRFRIIYSAFVVTSGNTGINFSASAVVPNEGYILDTVNFGGGGTYISGINNTSEKALFTGCRGVTNTSSQAGYYMATNATQTNITAANVFKKIAGTTTAGTLVEKFTITNNRATYTGALSGGFMVAAAVSIDTSVMRDYIVKLAKNGVVQNARSIIRGTNTINLECSLFDTVNLNTGDYLEIWIASNQTGNVSVTDLNVIITRLN